LERPSVLFHMLRKTEILKARQILVFCWVGFGMVHRSGGVRLSVLERPSVLFHMLRKTEMKARLISALQRQ
jgi:hypothetical protein